MAKQKGIIKLKGALGDISFYKTSDGYLAREKGGIEKSRIENDPAFQRTRENGAEFGRAGKGGKLVRNAIQLLLRNAKDKRVTSRLTKSLLAIIKTDAVNSRGDRVIVEGEMNLLQNFEFNLNAKFGTTFYVGYTTAIDRVAGEVTVDIEAFVPAIRIAAPSGTTHFQLSLGGAELDFANENHVFDMEQTGMLAFDSAEVAASTMTANLTAASELPIIAVLGIEFFQGVNGEMYPLRNGAFNSLFISKIDNP